MSADDEVAAVPVSPRRSRTGVRMRVAAVIALVVFGIFLGVWSQRRTIATHYVDEYLAEKGVRATYGIAELGFGRQRLTDVTIGDPARPDLVADWVELNTDVGLSGASVGGVRVGRVRLRGRLVDGNLSLGALDRLMPPPSGKPFALPALKVDVADARMRLETPQGQIGLKLTGRGRLDDGFAGTLAAVSDRLAAGGCVGERIAAAMAVRVAQAAPSLSGPVRAGTVTCGTLRVAGIGSDVTVALGAALDRWKGEARLAVDDIRRPDARIAGVRGRIGFEGSKVSTIGRLAVSSAGFSGGGVGGRGLTYDGGYALGAGAIRLEGTIGGTGVALGSARLAEVSQFRGTGAGSPVGPLVAQLVDAVGRAGRSFDATGRVGIEISSRGGEFELLDLTAASASGVRLMLKPRNVSYGWPRDGLALAGRLDVTGGGLPSASIDLADAGEGGGAYAGVATIQPYAAGSARIAFAPIRFSATPGGNSRFATRVTLSGPLGDGSVAGLDVPVQGLWNGRGRVALNPDCSAISWQRLAVSGLVLRPAALRLCPISGALVSLDAGRLSGGATIAAPRLAGALGRTPVTLAASGAELRLGDHGFGLRDVAVRLGSPERVTRLDFAWLDGKLAGASVVGGFAGGGGQIGNVPLILSAAAGQWGFRGGRLLLGGELDVTDAAPDPRFNLLHARNVSLALADNQIRVGGTLVTPGKDVAISDIAILHDLKSGEGVADLTVPGIAFAEKGLQPDDLTRLTIGVIANVVGTVAGEGHFAWSPAGVTSDGVFRTGNTDLAAALGPVTGIATEIRFTDLLNLQSGPGQTATIKSINTGIVVNDGVIRYQTLPNAQVNVESGRWPFAGGSLVLEPTLLDFSEARERRMTLTVTGMEAAKFLTQFEFDNLSATGTFDGRMPMVFDINGGRIEGGKLTVRPGGGTIAYLGEVSKENLGVWGNLAFQALRSLRYRSLDLTMNGPLSGEMVTEVRFAGVGQGEGAKRNFILDRLQRLPFVFNVKIRAPFRGLFDSARSFYDPSRLVERNLPALIQERDRQRAQPVQPQESEKVP